MFDGSGLKVDGNHPQCLQLVEELTAFYSMDMLIDCGSKAWNYGQSRPRIVVIVIGQLVQER